ncbi:TetR/AcrR family transcriptional regulator [Methylosinus sp. KRF6]|uniref:TetR/AcrR family transcriptional regulator n=1 Tax=Methylosinus sp. KRF6 TaxID=2846853 RepID=UPI001C0D11C0|nr:TetR/AcrR family transcriptional regulator [Methylosinus sp. KRF6]MBU3887902.1 TetR/AcrR family transcriptional regulator [Methylosinus sp. KRF6]
MTKRPDLAEPRQRRPRGRPRGDARERILRAARSLLAQQRYDEVSVPEIAASAGVAQGTFYLYFESKASLIVALTDDVQRAIDARISLCSSADVPAIELIGRLMEAGAAVCRDYADILPFLGSEALLFGSSRRAEELREPHLQRLAALIRRDQQAGLIRGDLSPAYAARLISAVLDQIARDIVSGIVSPHEATYKNEAMRFLRRAIELHGES